ncbi:hypothetical protein [Nocardia sp. CNY236]|uniref:hypothetical protein n=1 Tax=Nocardia sp. CNY236 TaxID=1169152 RepID=UPI0004125485|nr:hypothetical protein [Nocardia sp. CNY236]
MTRHRIAQLAAMMLAVLSVAGCSQTTSSAPDPTTTVAPPPAYYIPPDQVRDASAVWSADPPIDLLSSEAALVRAALESDLIGAAAGIDRTYPGFEEALDRSQRFRYNHDSSRGPTKGTLRGHIQTITPTATGFTAFFCIQYNNLARLVESGDYVRSHTLAVGADIEFSRDDPDPRPSTATTTPQTNTPDASSNGSWHAPTYDVFAGWRVEYPSTGTLEENRARCQPWSLTIDPTATELRGESIRSTEPPPTLPAFPGWTTRPR